MPGVKELTQKAEELMKKEAVLVTAAEYNDGVADRIQVYFWDEREAAMDVIGKDDLVQGFPDAGAYSLTDSGLKRIEMFEGEEDMYFRIDGTHEEADSFGPLPSVRFLETVEAISLLRDKKKL